MKCIAASLLIVSSRGDTGVADLIFLPVDAGETPSDTPRTPVSDSTWMTPSDASWVPVSDDWLELGSGEPDDSQGADRGPMDDWVEWDTTTDSLEQGSWSATAGGMGRLRGGSVQKWPSAAAASNHHSQPRVEPTLNSGLQTSDYHHLDLGAAYRQQQWQDYTRGWMRGYMQQCIMYMQASSYTYYPPGADGYAPERTSLPRPEIRYDLPISAYEQGRGYGTLQAIDDLSMYISFYGDVNSLEAQSLYDDAFWRLQQYAST